MFLGICIVAFILLIVVIIFKEFFWSRRLKSIENKHVVVTGASSGIGKYVAILAAQHGAHITIIARNINKLEEAKNEILQACKNKDIQRVEYISLDVSRSYEDVEKTLRGIEKTMGQIYMIVNCAGLAICGKIEDTSVQELHKLMDINFYGTYYCIKAVVQRMKNARSGIIVLTSSQAGLVGLYGYSGYCSTKFALRGLAESIAMELAPYNISVTLCLPPDTDTPGFTMEELSKPLETKLITQSQLVSPQTVANQLLKDALSGNFFSTVGMDGFVLTKLCCGMAPWSNISELLLQCLLMTAMRIVGVCYLFSFQTIIVNCMKTRDKNKKFE